MATLENINNWVKQSITLKLFLISTLILILLIPSYMIDGLIRERQNRRDEAVTEISSKWGGEQTISGPVLTIPFIETYKNDKGILINEKKYAHFLPEILQINGEIIPQERYRGIYVAVLYNTSLEISGVFSKCNLSILGIKEENCLTNEAFISLGITELKGVRNNLKISYNNNTDIDFNPGVISKDIFTSGVSTPIIFNLNDELNYTISLNLNGSSTLNFMPFGKETNVSINSKWLNPKFEGNYLPEDRKIDANGFNANWKILQLNRNYPQQGIGNFINLKANTTNFNSDFENYQYSQFGVKLMIPIDEYKKTERSTKYEIMFIILTFLAFFFIEILNKKRIHPVQYLLVGFAVIMFYILLLSISEHILFDYAYLISSVCILMLITFYAKSILKNNKLTLFIGFTLASLYTFFYSLLQLQDYSLLIGSLGLLVILSVIMFLTRNINWYNDTQE